MKSNIGDFGQNSSSSASFLPYIKSQFISGLDFRIRWVRRKYPTYWFFWLLTRGGGLWRFSKHLIFGTFKKWRSQIGSYQEGGGGIYDELNGIHAVFICL